MLTSFINTKLPMNAMVHMLRPQGKVK